MAAPETRAAAYTDALVAAVVAAASGKKATIEATAAAEICAGQWGRAFASAEVVPDSLRLRGLTASALGLIGRQLVLRGECVFEIRIRAGAVVLYPAADWTVSGQDGDPDRWLYELGFNMPGGSIMRRVRGDRVVHCRYAVDPVNPWAGVGPLAAMPDTSALAANLELRAKQEAGAATGRVIALPTVEGLDQLKQDLNAMNGGTMLVETTAGAWDGNPMDAPKRDWRTERIGANPPESLVNLRSETVAHVLAACGVPIDLVQRTDGTSAREAWRRFLYATVQPAGRLVEEELARKLDLPGLRLTWDRLGASDLAGRARAFQSMVGAGMELDRAAALAGLLVAD